MPAPPRADLTFDEVLNPAVRWCKCGHDIPENVKVYSVRGTSLPRNCWGDYCELCLAGAQKLAAAAKRPKVLPEEATPTDPKLLRTQLRRAGFVGGMAEVEEAPIKESWEEFLENI